MAKIKVSKKPKAPQKSISIKKPKIKIEKPKIKIKTPKIKVKKPNIKKIFSGKTAKTLLYVLAGVVLFILIDLFVQYLNNGYSVAVIDGSRITTNEYHDRLETSYGQAIAQQLIDEKLIEMEASKQGVEVTDEEVGKQLQEVIDSIGGQEAYESALIQSNIAEEDLKQQIKLDQLAVSILKPTIEYTDDDIKAFFEQYSSVLYPNETSALEEGEKLDYEKYKDEVEDIYVRQEVENSKLSWLEGLRNEYKIQNNSTTKPKYGILSATINILENIFNDANTNEIEEAK
jgi:hypothetical protein